jgi:lysophospholipase L1-like esterase
MPRITRRRKVLFGLVTLAAVAVLCELVARAAFAFMVGPRVFLYGTGAYRSEVKLFPSVVMAQVGHTPPTQGSYRAWNTTGAYAKFAPHEHKTDTDENGRRFHPTINGRGFRGAEFAEHKAPGVVRVITLGASSTFGYHDRDDETYPHYMEELLNGRAGGDPRFEVLNLGLPHMTAEQILAIFFQEALPLAPDVVTFYEGWNDAGLRPEDAPAPDERSVLSALRSRVLLHALADSLFYYAGETPLGPAQLEDLTAKRSARFLEHVAAIEEACRERGILFVVATQQACSERIGREERAGLTFDEEVRIVRDELARDGRLGRREASFLIHDGMMKELERWARENRVPLADVIEATDRERDVLLTYVHPNPRGNRRIAEELVEEILEHRLARGTLPALRTVGGR